MNIAPRLPRNETGIKAALDILKQRFGDRMQTGQSIREQHGHTTSWIENQAPDAVIFAQSTEEVAEIVKTAGQHNVPVVPFGAGTSLEGHVNAPAGGISVDLSQMDKVLEVHEEDLDAVVQPGVTRMALNEHLRATGLFFPIDPGANASLGGMAATGASGTNAVRYGTMRENVLSLEAVLPSGEIIRTGRRARKSSAGYDLTRLMIGSEGTLGLITELTVRLQGIPEAMSSAHCTFPSVDAACNAVIMTIQMGVPVARIELLDADCVRAMNAYGKLDLPVSPLLLLEFHGTEAGVAEQAETFGEIAEDAGGIGFAWTSNAEERTRIWQARHDLYWALCQANPGLEGVATDVCVPISNLAEAVRRASEKAAELNLIAPILGHVGDGNFHASVFVDKSDPQAMENSAIYTAWMGEMAIALDGTCTGEHGIGQGKVETLVKEMGGATDVMAAIKAAIDPQGIMNPGKVFKS
ncbi:MAG: FAD-binding protein [Silicimonas sp.]|nr:FAD-binding protein [Silicimonas sp.]